MAFGFSAEDVEMIIEAMAKDGKEPTFCMGDDIPLAVLSQQPHLLYDYFKQRFAQVTNPAIDPLREKLVMSLVTRLGKRGNLLIESPEDARLLQLNSPLVNEAELEEILKAPFGTTRLSTQFAIAQGPAALEAAVNRLCEQAAAAVKGGAEILVLSDRHNLAGEPHLLDADTSYIPPLLAVGAVHHHLIAQAFAVASPLWWKQPSAGVPITLLASLAMALELCVPT